jgi:putative two-component system response regulator
MVLQLAQEIALTHHERWDGTGYPSGLARELIRPDGRIVSVADVFDALTHTPLQTGVGDRPAVREICDGRARQFDPAVVEAFQTLDHEALATPIATPHPRR